MKWYKNEQLLNYAKKADEALDKKDPNSLYEISEKLEKLSTDYVESKMMYAYYLYISFTSLNNYIDIKVNNKETVEWEKLIEKSLFLARTAINSMDEYLKDTEIDEIEYIYLNGIYNSVKTNYCNLLISIGKYSSAIFEMRKLATSQFGMAIGNLGTEIFDYACFDYTDNKESLYKYAYQLLDTALTYEDSIVHPNAKAFYQSKIDILDEIDNFNPYDTEYNVESILKKDRLDDHNFTNNITNEDYWDWVAENSLALNTINDIDYMTKNNQDTLHLPNILTSINDHSSFYGIFNQIKQEYCSARYILYEEMYNNKNHFSDENVYLVNTIDYPKYGLNIERVKAAYRSAYALFDRIGYFLNKYFKLGLKDREVSFKRIWQSANNEIYEVFKNNIALKGMYWTYKDLFAKTKSKNLDCIDKKLRRTYTIRNIMEHRYLKVLDSNFIDQATSDYDNLSYTITSDELNELGINLIRICRELIILLCFTVNINENNINKDEKDKFVIMALREFSDEWKI